MGSFIVQEVANPTKLSEVNLTMAEIELRTKMLVRDVMSSPVVTLD